jgi:hypothetical protein
MFAQTVATEVDDIDIDKAMRFGKVAFQWNDAKSIARRLHINDMGVTEATDLLLIMSAIVPDVFDRAVDLEASTR